MKSAPSEKAARRATETVRFPSLLAKQIHDIAHAERKRVAVVVAEMFAQAIAARHAKLPKATRSV